MLMAKNSVPNQLENEVKHCSLDELTAQELQLALQLKKELCDENGKEIEPEISAPLFHQLGKLYQTKSKLQSKSKKLSLIKSAALFNAAIVRLESAPEDALNVKHDLQQLCTEVLFRAEARNKNTDLIGKAHSVKENIALMRNYVENELKDVQYISENISEKQVTHMEQCKTQKIQHLQAQIAAKYTEIMVDIACFCEEAMGEPPCKYAIAGMGSLARKEITPYSDFEHVIVLENISDYEPKLRYFKWFSVIFHVIIINIQETILPSVMVDSLNNHPEFGNWFFDAVTPSGISFDGMMPHACKFPLGRQTPTKRKPWKTELIKPVDEMLQYLQSGENLKNGYHLGDILTKVCFVFGDHSVYTEFENGVRTIVEKQVENDVQHLRRQVADDLQNFATSLHVNKKPHDKINVKKDVYRSTTLFISALGRQHKLCDPSCFDILHSLQQSQRIDEFTKQKLEYVVAVACEIRLRWYMEQKKQCDVIENYSNNVETLSRIVGVTSTIGYFQISYALQNEIAIQFKLKNKVQVFYTDPQLLNVDVCQMFGRTQELLPLLHNCESTLNRVFSLCLNYKRVFAFGECMDLLKNDSWALFVSPNLEKGLDISRKKEIAKQFQSLGVKLFALKSFNEAVNYHQKSYDEWIEIENEIFQIKFQPKDSSVLVAVGYSISKNDCQIIYDDGSAENQEVITKRFSDKITLKENREINHHKIDNWFFMGKYLLILNKPQQALEYFENVLQLILYMRWCCTTESMNLTLMDYNTVYTLHDLAVCFQRMEKYDDACKYLQSALNMLERLPPLLNHQDIPKENESVDLWVTFGRCLMEQDDKSMQSVILQKQLDFFKLILGFQIPIKKQK